jgi:hypothetical protein
MVCQPRCKGGLDVRDIKLVNICLLVKWRWHLLHDDSSLWKRVPVDKYGLRVSGSVESGGGGRSSFASRWWKDLMNLEVVGGVWWFNREMEMKLGNGM